MIEEHAVMTDSTVPWSRDINFASALLLHSCTTVIIKETLNLFEIMRRLCLRYGATGHRKSSESLNTPVSAVLDAYTSVFSNDVDAEQAELYFTNTGLALLATSLTSSVVMNIFFSDLALNILVSCTFGLTFAASLAIGQYKYSLPVMALRRAGRFIWSDTPFVNFFTLIYIATVLKGKSTLRLQDYVTFRSIAIVEWVFMKAKLASAVPDSQIGLIRKLIASKRIVLHEVGSRLSWMNEADGICSRILRPACCRSLKCHRGMTLQRSRLHSGCKSCLASRPSPTNWAALCARECRPESQCRLLELPSMGVTWVGSFIDSLSEL